MVEPMNPIALPQNNRKPKAKGAIADLNWQTFLDETRYDIWGPQELGPHDAPRDKYRGGRRIDV
jgi:hypothetical protein